MADLAKIERALRNADKAGDVDAATRLAAEYKRVRDAGIVDANAELSALTQAASTASQHDRDTRVRAELEATKLNQMRPAGAWRDFNDAAKMDGLPFADELFAATLGNVGRMVRDRVGPGEAYTREMALSEALAERRRERSPKASLAGAIAGGVGTGLTAAGGGLTLAGKALPVLGKAGTAALEGGAYGALYGAGEGRGADRLKNAAINATAGAVTAGLLSKGGDMMAARAARKAVPAAPSADDLATQANALYQQARAAGVTVNAPSVDKLTNNIRIAAGRINRDLRPKTAGIVEDAMALRGKPLDLQALDELRQTVGQAMKGADPQDVRTLMRVKDVIDVFADRATAADVSGNVQGFALLKQARGVYARKAKAEAISDLLDLADVKTGQYTQSGMANALRQKASQLYSRIVAGKEPGFSQAETAIIRQLAKAGTRSTAMNLLAKLAPRGVVSAGIGGGAGATIGSAVGGPVGGMIGAAVPGAVGSMAARSVDSAAVRAALALRDMAARGGPAILPKLPNKLVPYAVPGAIGAIQLRRELSR